jgi:succinyl-diaminopimelate desuccinylase
MKSGVAIGLKLALELENPGVDVTWIFYDNEEVESSKNGLGLLGAAHPGWVVGDFAIVGEPSNGIVEGGCNGTLRVEVSSRGLRAHSARSWMGDNAIHRASEILNRLVAYEPAVVDVDGLAYREGMNAVGVSAGVAGNVIPDLCTVTVNYRFAPNKSVEEAIAHVENLFEGFDIAVVDTAPGARPGLNHSLVHEFVTALGVEVAPKYGWTDVSRFGQWGIPALNYGPGDPALAHADNEQVEIAQIEACYRGLKDWLGSQGT